MQQSGLTPEELNQVLNRAAARQEAVTGRSDGPALTSDQDAQAIALELGIAPEHVRTALAEHRSGAMLTRRGPRKPNPMLIGGISVIAAAVALKIMGFGTLLVIGLLIAGLGLGLAAIIRGMRGGLASGVGTLPVAGTCRVCGAPAYNERATFCDDHRFRGAGAAP